MINIRDVLLLIIVGAVAFIFLQNRELKTELKSVKAKVEVLKTEGKVKDITTNYYRDVVNIPYKGVKIEKDSNDSNVSYIDISGLWQ